MRSLSSMLFILLAWFALPCNADFTASVDSTEISQVDTLKLTLRWSGTSARDSSVRPDFSPLRRDFEILSTGESSGYTFSTMGGRRQQSSSYVEWTLSLRPKRLGRITIPAMRYENLISRPIAINVARLSSAAKQRMNKLAFLITSVDSSQIYVQSQLIYTVKFYYRNSYDGALPLAPDLEDVLVKTLVEKNIYQTNVDGIRYFVAEWRYALFPQKSGELVLKREVIRGQIKIQDGGRFSLSRSHWERVQSESEGHRISVKPQPSTFTAANWLPAKSLTLTESWTRDPPVFTVGEPINRTITVVVQGVPVSLLAPLAAEQMENAKVYSDPTETDESVNLQGILATRIETIGLVPTLQGILHLPEIRIDWWNTERDRLEVVRIPAANYSVLPAPLSESIPFQSAVIEPSVQLQPAEELQPAALSTWIYIAAALTVAWILTTTQWLRVRRELYHVRQQYQHDPLKNQRDQPSEADIYKDITRSCRSSDPLAARAALLRWGKMHWSEHKIQGIHDLIKVVLNDQLSQAITDLDQHLFSPSSQQPWDGEQLLNLVSRLKDKLPDKNKDVSPAIPSLYPT